MAKYKIKNIQELSREELQKKLDELNLQLLKQKAQIAKGGALESPKIVREIKRNIARIKQRLAQLKHKKE